MSQALLLETVANNPYIRSEPTALQLKFLNDFGREAFYGGAAGGGKSFALLMAALQFVAFPEYNALLLRRTFQDLSQPEALIDISKDWLTQTPARWNESKKEWRFPSGAVLRFGYMDHENDKYQYQGSAYHFIGYDELTQFTSSQYTYLFSRQRRSADSSIPIRMRCASNPGGVGHEWVKERFIKGALAPFYPARIQDNPYLDQQEYYKALEQLDPLTKAQLLRGDWDATNTGRFKREWFKTYYKEGDWYKFSDGKVCHYSDFGCFSTVDPAATPEETTRKQGDSDYTVIGTYGRPPWKACVVLDVVRERLAIDEIVPRIASVCRIWKPIYVGIEALAFQAFLIQAARKRSDIPAVRALEPRWAKAKPGIRMKLARAIPAMLWAEAGQIYIPERAPWLDDWVSEVCSFTGDDDLDPHDDQVDSLAYAIIELERGGFIEGKEPDAPPQRVMYPVSGTVPGTARRGLYGIGA